MKGSYILLIELTQSKEILVGKLGHIYFPKGFYAYVGSAMNGLAARLSRHLREAKKLHWHIDYLLRDARIDDIVLYPAGRRLECLLAQALAKRLCFISGFGSSDCKCQSHLYFAHDRAKLRACLLAVISETSSGTAAPLFFGGRRNWDVLSETGLKN